MQGHDRGNCAAESRRRTSTLAHQSSQEADFLSASTFCHLQPLFSASPWLYPCIYLNMSTGLARTILGPLTTTATLPATCTLPVAQCLTCDQAWRAQTCYASAEASSTAYGVQDNSDCWPETTSFVAQPTLPLSGWGFYSPGIMCPSGMYSACSATAGGSSGWPVQFGMLAGETAVGCCPT